MYKEFFICSAVILLVILLNICTQYYTKESIEAIRKELDDLKVSIKQNDRKSAEEQIKQTIDEWNERYEILSYYIEHNELEKVKTELVTLDANIETEEYEQAIADINRGIFILEHIREKTSLQVKNIF